MNYNKIRKTFPFIHVKCSLYKSKNILLVAVMNLYNIPLCDMIADCVKFVNGGMCMTSLSYSFNAIQYYYEEDE